MSKRPTSRRGASKAKKDGNSSFPLSGLPGWLWLITGLAVGFFVAFLFRLSPDAVDIREVAGHPVPAEQSREPEAVFDFYTLLPESEVILPGDNGAVVDPVKRDITKPQQKVGITQENSTASRYLLQAGSFRSSKDADRLRAQLLLWGLNPRVEKVNVGNEEYWHRVQLGPFDDKNTLHGAQKILADHNMDSLLLKMR
ncbi:SPOR domain-containing protein [Endozoicomonas sp. Mp262]|uniref:SPOR domain-containing protein n=1 Tax=Endozoicomonas sp. Mp262 TaxID=2919499 RepID=UPI0021DB3E77